MKDRLNDSGVGQLTCPVGAVRLTEKKKDRFVHQQADGLHNRELLLLSF